MLWWRLNSRRMAAVQFLLMAVAEARLPHLLSPPPHFQAPPLHLTSGTAAVAAAAAEALAAAPLDSDPALWRQLGGVSGVWPPGGVSGVCSNQTTHPFHCQYRLGL